MKIANLGEGKKKLLQIYGIGITAMLIIAYFAAPYSIVRVGCEAGTGLFDCIAQEPKILFLLFMMPALLIIISLLTVLFSEKETEKAALSSNMPKIIRMNTYMTIFFVIGSLLMFTVSYIPKEFLKENVKTFETGWYALTSILMLYTANITGKMNKSFFSGWPTYWNQKSELVWEKSQRFMGFALTFVSLASFVIAFVWVDIFMYVLIGGIALAYLGCWLTSYLVYKKENSKNLNH